MCLGAGGSGQTVDYTIEYPTKQSKKRFVKRAQMRTLYRGIPVERAVQEVTKLSDKDKEYIFVTLDALIRDFKNKQAYAK